MIRRGDRVSSVLARDEGLVEVFVGVSPAFAKLRNGAMRRSLAKLVTVEQAARIAGVDADRLVDRLNQALGGRAPVEGAPLPSAAPHAPEPSVPPALLATPAERIVDVDVREDLRAGREPFRKIMDAARSLPAGSVLRVRAIFEPSPLYGVLGKLGLAHATEQLADDDWRIWFHRESPPVSADAEPAAPTASPAPSEDSGEVVVVVDVRDLEPPEPMIRTLEALEALPRGGTVVQINVRVPQFLLPKLEERGFTYEVREQSPDLVRLFIRHKNP